MKGVSMVRNNWYKLDNVGKFYFFTNKNKIPAVFRYSVSLKEVIDEEILQNALNDILKYFPNFNCCLKNEYFGIIQKIPIKLLKLKKKNTITYMEYYIFTKKTLELAHKYNASLTALLTSILICSYQKMMKELELNKSIKIDIPVDLRQFFKESGINGVMNISEEEI